MNHPQTLRRPPHRLRRSEPEPQPSRPRRRRRHALSLLGVIALLGLGCTAETGSTASELRPECTDAPDALPAGEWLCPDTLEVECTDGYASPEVLYAEGSKLPAGACGEALWVDDPGPYPVGTTNVSVVTDGGVPVCLATIEVVDTLPPTVVEQEPGELWPPNHRMVDIHVDDCVTVTDRCDRDVDVFFTRVESDEPMDDIGDGNHEPDMVLATCDQVSLRAERQGPMDGRVYTLHWRAVDDAGFAVDGTCEVPVPHDQSGAPAIKGAPLAAIEGCATL